MKRIALYMRVSSDVQEMEHIGHGDDMREKLRRMSDDELITVFNDFVERMD